MTKERINNQFPDKKKSKIVYDAITQHVQEAKRLNKEMEVGQEKATWLAYGEYPNLPIMFVWMSDIHYGHLGTDYDLLNEHFAIIEDTPNTYVAFGGDLVDNFSAIKHPQAGIAGDPISPQTQTEAIMSRISDLDRQSKVAALTFGNHDDWIQYAGYDYYQTFMRELQAPIFHKGGLLHTIVNGGQHYKIAMSHMFWGRSKLNPENAGRRMLEFGFPGADIALYGHDHQAAGSMFDRGGLRKLVVDGGTYKTGDSIGGKWGLGQAGEGGYTVMLWPNERRIELFRDPLVAQQFMLGLIYQEESGKKT